ncbi:MAG: penicillin acylase family protein [Saprospiraceae bacterium]|jgi:acyl-homoserine lactone acylase PvdQ|nr:penicillin acylase family protein [Saprospiraceae bacterium]MBL0024102.1 penicillin acylase family protein [Saprospiraceae bacterium]
MKSLIILLFFPALIFSQSFNREEISQWENQASQVTIIRDNYGVPHIYGKTDADAVFGLLYAQCEDDFKRVEMNYIDKLARLSEVNGESDIYNDLLIRLVIDTSDAIKDYKKAPVWLKKILDAYADGINYYLYKNPNVKPALLTRFKPWYPLLWTDGSIGAISTGGISLNEMKGFYSGKDEAITSIAYKEECITGSNGFAFSPKITESGNAILYINPHVTFYFRPEVHMISEEGLNAYGAVTWGQPFVYQGFNQNCGWMHTSSQADISDAYIEKLVSKKGKWYYEYDGKLKPVIKKLIQIKYKTESGYSTKSFNALYTHHGPIMTKRDGNYLSLKHNNRDTNGFIQSWLRTKASGFSDFKKTMDMGANPSNNTVYADGEGNIAYWHGNFLPKRDPSYDWSNPVDGSIKATEWNGYHTVEESLHMYNPENGWLQNCNSSPFAMAGKFSPKKEDYAKYLAPDGENFRGINAVRVLDEQRGYTIEKVIKAGYDTRLAAFDILIPALVQAFEKSINYNDSLYAYLIGPISVLKNWDTRSGVSSVATTLAIEWAQKILPSINRTKVQNGMDDDIVTKTKEYASSTSSKKLLEHLLTTIHDLEKNHGRWQVPWGEINRIQRISTDIENKFDDNKPSYPVGFASSAWGMLPSFNSRTFTGTKKRYGYNGNSFIAAVEFGKRIKAKSLLAGGQNGDPDSPHFFDQGEMYSKGQFKDVLFYRDDVLKNAEATYHPGEK